MGARYHQNQMITGWKVQLQDGGGIKAIWQSPTGSFAAPGTQAIMTEDTKFELTITNKAK